MNIDIVFDGPPGPQSGRFIEVEDSDTRASVGVGEWTLRDDGYWVLRLKPRDLLGIELNDPLELSDYELVDLRQRIWHAMKTLEEDADAAQTQGRRAHLKSKREGVALVLDYLRLYA